VDDLDTPDAWLAVTMAWVSIDRPFPAAYARFRAAAAILRDRGDRAAATAALELALETAIRLGARPLRGSIEQLARQGRLPIHQDGTDAAAGRSGASAAAVGLTEREVEVLRLIAGGWSNAEIADELFISRKTASVHASHIFDKLGAGNRAEAAAIAHRLGLVEDPPSPPGSARGSA
jgi:DNA-binding NarL/FixJ family response regulator